MKLSEALKAFETHIHSSNSPSIKLRTHTLASHTATTFDEKKEHYKKEAGTQGGGNAMALLELAKLYFETPTPLFKKHRNKEQALRCLQTLFACGYHEPDVLRLLIRAQMELNQNTDTACKKLLERDDKNLDDILLILEAKKKKGLILHDKDAEKIVSAIDAINNRGLLTVVIYGYDLMPDTFLIEKIQEKITSARTIHEALITAFICMLILDPNLEHDRNLFLPCYQKINGLYNTGNSADTDRSLLSLVLLYQHMINYIEETNGSKKSKEILSAFDCIIDAYTPMMACLVKDSVYRDDLSLDIQNNLTEKRVFKTTRLLREETKTTYGLTQQPRRYQGLGERTSGILACFIENLNNSTKTITLPSSASTASTAGPQPAASSADSGAGVTAPVAPAQSTAAPGAGAAAGANPSS